MTAAPLAYRPGHYYSPICEPREISARYVDPLLSPPSEIAGIDLRTTDQLERWRAWQEFLPVAAGVWRRYEPGNAFYAIGDANPLHCVLREMRPRRLIEVGCGLSSGCILDTIEAFSLPTVCTFIDPDLGRIGERNERHSFIQSLVQHVSPALFDELDAGDVLLIDSTHVVKTGSDVVFHLFEILPRLKPGVWIHFHDIFHPFEYPPIWALERNNSWNEAYALRAFLSFNDEFRIEFWGTYVRKLLADPTLLRDCSNLWLSRVAARTRPGGEP
jgi:hypothetical protein